MFSNASRFESLFEAVPALLGMDSSGVIRFVNHQSELLFGYDRGDVVGRHVEMLVPDTLWQVYREHRDDYFADPRSRAMGLDLELRGRHRDGCEFPVTVSLSGIDTGDVLLAFSAVGDQSRRKQAFETAQWMTAIVQNSDDAIITKTRGGGPELESWSREDVRLLGQGDHWQVHRPDRAAGPGR